MALRAEALRQAAIIKATAQHDERHGSSDGIGFSEEGELEMEEGEFEMEEGESELSDAEAQEKEASDEEAPKLVPAATATKAKGKKRPV